PNEILGPAAFVNGRVDQFGSRIGFVQGHRSSRVMRRIIFPFGLIRRPPGCKLQGRRDETVLL
ncbi:MAG: hypothetical protein KKD24_01325, partial [Proteobacteria bacterium]|nr:hypothetical protein [Pseudomonadota bacterium]